MRLEPQSVLGGRFGEASPVGEFRSERATLRERSDVGCVLLTTAAESPELVAATCKTLGVVLPLTPGAVTMAALWLTLRSWLIQCDRDEEASLASNIAAAFPDKRAHAVPFSDAICWMELSGPGSFDLLTEGGFISLERDGLPIGHAKRTLIAQIPVVLIHQDADTWLLAVERSRATYFVQWLSGSAATPE